jgi:hypothetical protein
MSSILRAVLHRFDVGLRVEHFARRTRNMLLYNRYPGGISGIHFT